MAQGSRQVQTQAQQQIQTLSPQQILVVKLLELPAVELEDRVRAELLENPALEEGKEEPANDEYTEDVHEAETGAEDEGDTSYDSLSDYLYEDDIPDYKLQENNRSKDEQPEEIPFSDATSFYETLKEQLGERALNEHQRELTEYLIGSLDDDGLLRKSLDSISDELAIYAGIEATTEELEEALKIVQDFDPAGLGARSLQECLLIQIRRKIEQQQPTPNPLLTIEEAIVSECYEEFTRKHWDKIQQKLGLEEEALQQAIKDICKLNPRPGSSLGEAIGKNMQQIVPDFIVDTYDDGTINLSLNNRNVPELRMSRDFTEMVEEHTKNKANQSKESKEAMMFLKQKMDAAQGFIDAVKQRQNTLMTTMQAIIDLQRPFFLEGDESLLRPMILKDVAERTGLDISTISRVSNSKYVQTNYGIYPLKFFFNDGYTTEGGEEMSVREIRKILKECIDKEDKKKPLTDDELTDLLKEKGYPIARRTVAKYRQQMNIPVARLRK
ncbi:MAG: RNA polymerase factor sigma-54 [Bacteroides sp.]|nr:RNA polymerase factor sigma-54 [Bacteroides sp.]